MKVRLVWEIAQTVWIIGGIGVGLWFVYTNFRFRKKLSKGCKELQLDAEIFVTGEETRLPIYLSEEVETPCLYGLFYPAIYVTYEVLQDEEILRHVIAHETTHYLHKDYIWGYLRALCLAIHWYNPFVWCAAILSQNDAEMACDEMAIERLGEVQRVSYGHTLIGLTREKQATVLLTATTMTGSKKSIKERIYMIAKKTKTKVYTGIIVVIVSILCVGCTFTGAKDLDEQLSTESGTTETENTETENTLTGTIVEQKEEESRQEIELRIEELEKQVEFYQNTENGTIVTDTSVIERILRLLQEENAFDRMLMSEFGYDGTQENAEVNGQTVFLIEDATNWQYYEDLASAYYSDAYIETVFTPFFLDTVYMEEDGKLYRTFADGVVNPLLDSTIQAWQGNNGKYYVSIAVDAVSGEYLQGYMIGLSENNSYGFEILGKVSLLDDNASK